MLKNNKCTPAKCPTTLSLPKSVKFPLPYVIYILQEMYKRNMNLTIFMKPNGCASLKIFASQANASLR